MGGAPHRAPAPRGGGGGVGAPAGGGRGPPRRPGAHAPPGGGRGGGKLYRAAQGGGARAPSSRASSGGSSRRRIAGASPRGSPGATTSPQPSRISGIIDTDVETIGRPSAIASKSFAGTWPTVSVVARWGTATTSAATR